VVSRSNYQMMAQTRFTSRTHILLRLLLLWQTTLLLALRQQRVAQGFATTTSIQPRTPSSRRLSLHGTQTTTIPVCEYHQVTIPFSSKDGDAGAVVGPPRQEIIVHDLTGMVQDLLRQSNMTAGTVTVCSRHTTTAIVINEYESRLARDIAATFQRLIPLDERSVSGGGQGVRYQHNDIDQRPESADEAARCVANGWDISNPRRLQEWRDQEPINAHSHLLAMLLGSSESIPVVNSTMVIGQWQSILLLDLDGPRDRTVGIQLTGFCYEDSISGKEE
jgi:thiamine phosphate synthase YjbQ (UPF0047 family)